MTTHRIRFAAGVAATLLVAASASAEVLINELTIQGTEQVELYNSGPGIVDVNGWTIEGSAESWVIQGAAPMIGDSYLVLTPPGDLFGDQGGYVELFDVSSEDRVNYGQLGSAPLPPGGPFPSARGGPVTLARAPDGSSYGGAPPSPSPATDGLFWTIDVTPTLGAANDAPVAALGTSLRINELDPKPAGGGDSVELYNPFAVGMPLAGWFLCNGDAFLALAGTVPSAGFLTVVTPGGFDLEEDEVIYLFRGDGVRVDQVGLHLPPVRAAGIPALDVCQCFARYPDGSSPHVGYDWVTSGGGDTLRQLVCTPGAANEDQSDCAVGVSGPAAATWGRTKAGYR
jgi:hypothetical protein